MHRVYSSLRTPIMLRGDIFRIKIDILYNLVLDQASKQKLPDVPEGVHRRSDHQALLVFFKTYSTVPRRSASLDEN